MANHRQSEMEEDQVSMTIENDNETSDSESESCDSNSAVRDQFGIFSRNGMRRLDEEDFEYDMIKMSLITGMGNAGRDINIVAVHKNIMSHDSTRKARLVTFQTFSKAVAQKCGGNPGIRFAWYTGSKDELSEIVVHGFSRCRGPNGGHSVPSATNESQRQSDSYGGVGVHLIPHQVCWDAAISSPVDENGVKHMLLCRLILGRVEVVSPGSRQSLPSSKDLDTGVDSVINPKRYIVWSAFMNSHISPCFVVSFKAPCGPRNATGFQPIFAGEIGPRTEQQTGFKPTSDWISFPTMMSMLCKFLNRPKMEMLVKCYNQLTANKITRQQAVLRLRRIVGDDKLLAAVIKKQRSKMTGIPTNNL